MPNLTTELTLALLRHVPLDEFFRAKLEEAVNQLLKAELSAFLGYGKHSTDGWGSGNSRNGSHKRTLATAYGDLHIEVPRDRNGDFKSPPLPERKQRVDAPGTTVIQPCQRGMTARQIAGLIEQMYGHCYSPAAVPGIASGVAGQADGFHARPVAARYAVVSCDATCLSLRRDSVAKEALHVILGITPDGRKEALGYAICPAESASAMPGCSVG